MRMKKDIDGFEICFWKLSGNTSDEYYYDTACNENFSSFGGDIKCNRYEHCPFCGGKIKV